MKEILIQSQRPYMIHIGHKAIEEITLYLQKASWNKAFIIIDENVKELYGERLEQLIDMPTVSYSLPSGEMSKSIEHYYKIIRSLSAHHFDRYDVIIAFGGGVVGDLTGFVASTYLRGVDYIQIPTSLLSFVDASVGSKTGINTEDGKNLIGTFYDPTCVLMDIDMLRTLPQREYASGIAEIIKYGMIKDEALFLNLYEHQHVTIETIEDIIYESVNIKKYVVEQDLRERGERKILNFGHTFGHAIEKISNYRISHGSAVAMGMVMMTSAFVKKGLVDEEVLFKLCSVCKKYKLPIHCEYSAEALYNVTLKDKKNKGDTIDLVYTPKIGKAAIIAVPKQALIEIIQWGKEGDISEYKNHT